MMENHWLGIDTGGTFTDFVYFDGHSVRIHKVLSTPEAPEQAILQGIHEMGVPLQDLQLIHGSTVATNAVLEGKGVATVYITNRGFADVLRIGRQARRELYNLSPQPVPPLIAPDHCLEVDTRLSADGTLLKPLDQGDIDHLIDQIEQLKPRAAAINLLFSFLQDDQEKQIRQQLQAAFPDLFISCSSEVLAECREYERGMATTLNAYVGPLMQGYLGRLENQLAGCSSLSIMQSNGGTISAAQAAQYGVNLLLSGPAGGLKAAQYIASSGMDRRLMSFDMGGTSTDVAIIDGNIRLSSEAHIGDYPVPVPMVDMHTIGAGGGSIAYLDAGGLLNVGPRSAGASPGPACYGRGGLEPTVTDANLVLGRLRADAFLKQDERHNMRLDIEAARAAIGTLAEQLGLSIEDTAAGIIRIANEHMVRALRHISIERGHDPKNFTLVCFGGAGGLHVCALADAMQMNRALVPIHSGVLSALGMLVSAPSRELSHACIQPLDRSSVDQLEPLYRRLQDQGLAEMEKELIGPPQFQRSVDLRYRGQSFSLNCPWQADLRQLEQSFHQLHEKTYGHQLAMPVELVNIRLHISGEAPPFRLPDMPTGSAATARQTLSCHGIEAEVAVYQRGELSNGQRIEGPALILETVSTTLIATGWCAEVDSRGNLLLSKTDCGTPHTA